MVKSYVKEVSKWALLLLFVALYISWFMQLSINRPKDTTDPANGLSGLRLYTDDLTGCQYLSSGNNVTLIPRVAPDGKTQLGCGNTVPH